MILARRPTYDEIVRGRIGTGAQMHPTTRRIIALAPGDVLGISPEGGDLASERRRLSSRMRTAALVTHRRYHMSTRNGRLFVACEEETA